MQLLVCVTLEIIKVQGGSYSLSFRFNRHLKTLNTKAPQSQHVSESHRRVGCFPLFFLALCKRLYCPGAISMVESNIKEFTACGLLKS